MKIRNKIKCNKTRNLISNHYLVVYPQTRSKGSKVCKLMQINAYTAQILPSAWKIKALKENMNANFES